MNHASRTEEQEGLKEGVSCEMKDGDGVGAGTYR